MFRPPDLRADALGNARLLGGIALGAFVVLTLGFMWLLESADGRVVGENAAVPDFTATPPPGAAEAVAVGRGAEPVATASAAGAAVGASSLAAPAPAAEWRTYTDGRNGFTLMLPADWRQALAVPPAALAADMPDYDVVFERPDRGQRLAVSAWMAGERPPFAEFVAATVAGMQSVDGLWPTNAFIAGAPALVVGSPEGPTTPLAYAAYLEHEDRYLRLSWAAYDGAGDTTVFARALASLAWPSGAVVPEAAAGAVAGPAAPPTVPRFLLPAGVYFPSEALFAADAAP